jgi:hypothetical protein
VEIVSTVPELDPPAVRRALSGLPRAHGYAIRVIPLRYRGDKPHLSAWTDFDVATITIQVPDPFLPFGEVVPYGAVRRPGSAKLRFIWLTEGVTFRTPREVLRYLYLHEWMHWYLRERLGRKSRAETACDRFALRNYRRRSVTEDDASAALRRQSDT